MGLTRIEHWKCDKCSAEETHHAEGDSVMEKPERDWNHLGQLMLCPWCSEQLLSWVLGRSILVPRVKDTPTS